MTMRLSVLIDGNNAGLRSASNKAEKDLKGIQRQAHRTSDAIDRLRPAMLGVAGSLAGAFSIYEMTQFADEAANIRNRLKDVTKGAQEYAEVQALVRDISENTRTSISATAELYARLHRATDGIVGSNEELAGVIDTINKSFTLSGASVQEANAAIIQLSQGLSAGVLRGDEFNSVAEQAPEILKAVQRQTGKTKAEIREMAQEGRISSELLIRSLQNYAGEVDRRFAQTEATINQYFTVARNNFVNYISDLDEATGASGTMGEAVVRLSTNLDGLSDAMIAIVALGASKYVPGIYSAVAAKIALTRATLSATPAVTGLSAALGMQAKKATAATVATNALALSQRALAATLGFLTGPAGLIMLAAGAVAYFATTSGDAAEQTKNLNGKLDESIAKYRELNELGRSVTIEKITLKEIEARNKLINVQQKINALAKQRDEIEKNSTQANALYDKGDLEKSRLQAQIEILRRESQGLEGDLAALAEQKAALFDSTMPEIKTQPETDGRSSKGEGDNKIQAMLDNLRTETDLIDAELQIQRQVRAGHISEEEGQIYASFMRREQMARDTADQLEQTIRDYYNGEIEAAAGNAERIAELDQEKKTKLLEAQELFNEQTRMMGEEQRLALEEANKGFFDRMMDHMRVTAEDFDAMWGNTFDRFAQGIGDATATAIVEQKSLGDAAKALTRSAIKEVISGLIQIGVKYVAMKALQATADTTTAGTSMAATTTAATTAAAAWSPAAAFASLAMAGTNAPPAMAGISSTFALAQGLQLTGIAHGGLDRSMEGTYLLRKDEMVLNPKQRENFDAMRKSFEDGNGGNRSVVINSNPTFQIDASGSTMTPEQYEEISRQQIAEFDAQLQEDFASNGARSQMLYGRNA